MAILAALLTLGATGAAAQVASPSTDLCALDGGFGFRFGAPESTVPQKRPNYDSGIEVALPEAAAPFHSVNVSVSPDTRLIHTISAYAARIQ